jgi:hypothetical protein
MNIVCPPNPCPIKLNTNCVFYTGPNLPVTGIVTNDNVQITLTKIEALFKEVTEASSATIETAYVVPTPGENSFSVPGLQGKTLLLAFRSGLAKGITSSPTSNSLYLQVSGGTVTLPIGDVVESDELFIFLYR